MSVKTILFPSSFFDGKKVDEDLQSEYEAVLNTGLWNTIFFNYDKWFNEGELSLSGKDGIDMARVWKEGISPKYMHDNFGIYQGIWMPQMDRCWFSDDGFGPCRNSRIYSGEVVKR